MTINNDKIAFTDIKSGHKQPRTQAGELREILATLEKRIAKLREISPEDALEILPLFDQANGKLDILEKAGVTTSGEATQLELLLSQFHTKQREFVRKVGGVAAMQQTRQAHQPDESQWWWFIDEAIAKERQSKFIRWIVGLVIAGAILAGLAFAYQQFFAPDPIFQAGIGFQQAAENKLINGEYEAALADVNQAIDRLPDAPELFVMRGVIFEMLEKPDLAEESFVLARLGFDQEDLFYNARAKYYLMAGLPNLAIIDAEMAISINPDSAVNYLFIAQANEMLGNYSKAIEYYEIASEAAERTNNATLTVIIRMQLATLLQQNQIQTTIMP